MGRDPAEQPTPDLLSTATVRDAFTADKTMLPRGEDRNRTATVCPPQEPP